MTRTRTSRHPSRSEMRITLIVAAARNGVIGQGDALPWRLPEDMKFFKATTMGHHVLMGRKTWESLPKPLPGRTNVVVTRQPEFVAAGARVVGSVEAGVELAANAAEDELFVIGGGQIYEQLLPQADRIYLTRVDADVDGDVRFDFEAGRLWTGCDLHVQAADERHAHPFVVRRYDRSGRPPDDEQ